MIVGALPLSEHVRRVYFAGWLETTKIWLAKFRKARPADHASENASNTIAGLLSWLTCPVPPGARKGPGNQT
jgi:hypothetical protein